MVWTGVWNEKSGQARYKRYHGYVLCPIRCIWISEYLSKSNSSGFSVQVRAEKVYYGSTLTFSSFLPIHPMDGFTKAKEHRDINITCTYMDRHTRGRRNNKVIFQLTAKANKFKRKLIWNDKTTFLTHTLQRGMRVCVSL